MEEKIKEFFPESHLIGGFSETSYYFPKVTKEKAKQLLDLVMRYRPEEGADLSAQLDKVPDGMPIAIRLRRRKNLEDKSFILTLKASPDPLHDAERIEIETSDISENFLEGFAANSIEPESVWHSNRRVYGVDDHTRIDVQRVSGYGWTSEIESSDLARVREIADKLGLRPLSPTLLGAMYEQYKNHWQEYYNGEGDREYFSGDDWNQIEAFAKEKVARNQVPTR